MDYLVYIEHNAENLQFWLWYRDYVRRFDTLPENQKELSPAWVNGVPGLSKDSEKDSRKIRNKSSNLSKAELGLDKKGAILFCEDQESSPGSNLPWSSKDNASLMGSSAFSDTTTLTDAAVVAQAGLKWQPCMFVTTIDRLSSEL